MEIRISACLSLARGGGFIFFFDGKEMPMSWGVVSFFFFRFFGFFFRDPGVGNDLACVFVMIPFHLLFLSSSES